MRSSKGQHGFGFGHVVLGWGRAHPIIGSMNPCPLLLAAALLPCVRDSQSERDGSFATAFRGNNHRLLPLIQSAATYSE